MPDITSILIFMTVLFLFSYFTGSKPEDEE